MTLTNFKDLAKQAGEMVNHNETQTVEYEKAPEGKTVARLIEYIETGVQPRKPYNGQPRKPVAMVKMTFELLGANHVKEIEVDGVKKLVANRISLPMMPLSLNDRANYKKTYEKMKYGRNDITHGSQMLGEAFIIDVKHNKSEDGKKTYVNIENIEKPYQVDALAGTETPLQVREAISDYKLFIFDMPTKECWDSIFIDGSREETKDNGEKVEVSKNYLQEMIMKSENYVGSAVEQMLGGLDDLPELAEKPVETVQEAPAAKTTEVLSPATVADLDALDM